MTGALLCCLVLGVNCVYAIAGLCAAERYGVDLRLCGGSALGTLLAGTALECGLVCCAPSGMMQLVTIVAFGAVVTGAACDAACGYVFDVITLPCLAVMLAITLITHALLDVAGGAFATGGALYALHALTRGRGLGLGDVKLAGCIGACTGALGGIEALGVAFVLGGIYAGFLLLTKRAEFGAELRFAPYLAAGMAVVMMRGAAI